MRRDLIARLRCPYTGSRFKLTSVIKEDGAVVDWAS